MSTYQHDTPLFALLVGVDNYPVDPILGAAQDARSQYNFLVDKLGVPKENIILLKDEEATRQRILDEFRRHLIDNPNIRRGDARLFHFSGHGCRQTAPAGWPTFWTSGDQPLVEMIVPYDAVYDDGSKGFITGIPDRTLASLLRRASEARGNNVTVILDCCHSGSGTRGGFEGDRAFCTRSIEPEHVGAMDPAQDKDIWKDDECEKFPVRSGDKEVRSKERDSHILMAACEQTQNANGCEDGGWLTTAWLEIMGGCLRDFRKKEIPIQFPSYGQMCTRIEGLMRQKRATYLPLSAPEATVSQDSLPSEQTPQCEGWSRDQEVFKICGDHTANFAVAELEGGSSVCVIHAGIVHNVTKGAIFDLRHGFSKTVVGTAVVTDSVEWNTCVARLPQDFELQAAEFRAYISNLADPLKFAVINSQVGSVSAAQNYTRLDKRLNEGRQSETSTEYERVAIKDNPDLILNVNERRISFQRRDEHMNKLEISPGPIEARDIEKVFPGVLGYIARFNFYLTQSSPSCPFLNHVKLQMFALKQLDDLAAIDGEYAIDENHQIEFVDDLEATVEHNEETLYSLVLKNYGDTPLYVHIFWFDPSTYSIERFFETNNANDPPLKARSADGQPGMLQIGGSPECTPAISLLVKEDGLKDSGFLKVVLATEAVPLFLQQGPMTGYSEALEPNFVRSKKRGEAPGGASDEGSQPIKGQWDTILRKITVEPRH